jgi:sulfite exporter TauE/SafE
MVIFGMVYSFYYMAFVSGLLSTAHCIWMCGGIIGTLTLSLQRDIQNKKRQLALYVIAYNVGRIGTYMVAGTVGGLLGSLAASFLEPSCMHTVSRLIVFLTLLGMGLYLAGWFPGFAMLESLGKPVWRLVEPIGQRMLPVRHIRHAIAFGAIWGLIPCGLSYSAFIWAASTGSPTQAAFVMLAYGMGTLPSVMTAGLFTGWIVRFTRLRAMNYIIGLILIGLALVHLFYTGGIPPLTYPFS